MPSGFFYFNSLDKFISNRRGVWLVFFYQCHILQKYLTLLQTMYTLIRHRILWRLIRVHTVCQCLSYGTLGLYGLIKHPKIYNIGEHDFIFTCTWACRTYLSFRMLHGLSQERCRDPQESSQSRKRTLTRHCIRAQCHMTATQHCFRKN